MISYTLRLRLRRRGSGEREPEGGAPSRSRLGANRPPHEFHQSLGDRQAKPGPAMPPADRAVHLGEALEQLGLQIGLYPRAGIRHLELQYILAVSGERHVD